MLNTFGRKEERKWQEWPSTGGDNTCNLNEEEEVQR
jgi:hypothetical protein